MSTPRLRARARLHRLARPRVLVVAGAALIALIVVGSAAATSGGSGRTGARARSVVVPGSYVAIGDSYTSGPAIPTQLGPTTTPSAPAACQRSSANYPSLTARALGLQLTDVSCGGATTADLTGPQGPGIPPQLDALHPSTALVTVGIGGNDLGFSTIATACAALTPVGPTEVGLNCRDHYTSGGTDRLAVAAHRVGERVAVVLADVRHRAPHAGVLVIGYPDIVPQTGSGCWPFLPFTDGDLAYLRGVEADLNAALADAARAAGDTFVDMATPSAPHDACSPAPTRWVEPVIHPPGSFPLHPGATGMAGMAGVLTATLRGRGIR